MFRIRIQTSKQIINSKTMIRFSRSWLLGPMAGHSLQKINPNKSKSSEKIMEVYGSVSGAVSVSQIAVTIVASAINAF